MQIGEIFSGIGTQAIFYILAAVVSYWGVPKIAKKIVNISKKIKANNNQGTINQAKTIHQANTSIGVQNNYYPPNNTQQNSPEYSSSQTNLAQIKLNLITPTVNEYIFKSSVYNNETEILNKLNEVVGEYIQKRNSYKNYTPQEMESVQLLNNKLDSMLQALAVSNSNLYDEQFGKLFINPNYEIFVDEIFVTTALKFYKKNWKDKNSFNALANNMLKYLENANGDYIKENDCSRILDIFFDDMNLELQYRIAFAYYSIYIDNLRKKDFPQKKFADRIYNALGFDKIVRKMVYPELEKENVNIDDLAGKYRLSKKWLENYKKEIRSKKFNFQDFSQL